MNPKYLIAPKVLSFLQIRSIVEKYLRYFLDFHKGYFSVKKYGAVALYVSVLIAFNYLFDFEDRYVDKFTGKPGWGGLFFLYHAIAFYGVVMLIAYIEERKYLKSPEFWMKSILIFTILAFHRSFYAYASMVQTMPAQLYRFAFKCLANSKGLFTILLPSVALFLVFDRKEHNGFYGLKFRNVNLKPYWIMLLVMMPIIFFATLNDDISAYYPTYKRTRGDLFAAFFDMPELISKIIFEVVYILSFIFTELFFRGLLVIGLMKILGKDCILPMVATYAVLHFGKPLTETIGSVFGGYILGIITYYSKNIWGGVFVHGGIALLMELFTF